MPASFRLRPLARALLASPVLHTLALACLLPIAAQVQAQAQAQESDFLIPAQPLDSALQTFAKQTNLQLLYNPDDIKSIRSNALSGRKSPGAALQQLLQGTGFGSKFDGNVVTLTPASETLLNMVKVTDRGFAATTEGTGSYTSSAVTIGKTEQKLKDIPQSITVLTRQRMDDQNLVTLPDILNSVTGVTFSKSPGPGGFITARGFELGTLQYDGVPLTRNTYSLGSYTTETTTFYDRVEVLRGAAGLLQGAGSAGGAVNFVRKRPQATPTVTLTAKAGSWDRYSAEADVGGPLNDEGTLRGRALANYEQGDSFVDYVWNREQKLYAALDYDATAATTVGVAVSHRNSHYRPYFLGLPRYSNTDDIGLSRSTFTGSTWNRGLIEQTGLYADLEHRFNDTWKLKISSVAIDEKNEAVYQYMVGPVTQTGSGARYFDYATDFETKNRGVDIYLSGAFNAWGLEHETVLGANYSNYTTDEAFVRVISAPSFNIFNIDHERPYQDFESIESSGSKNYSTYDVQQKGIYGTWRAKLSEPLTLVVGGRSSWYENIYDALSGTTVLTASKSESEASGRFTPYAGLIYAIDAQWSAYGSYSEVFIPQTERTVSGSMLKPIEGVNYELGIKGELADGRLNTSFAAFRYDHENRAVNDIASGYACNNWYCSIASGKIRSDGFEAEASGEVLTGLQVFAGYAFTLTKFVEDLTYEDKIASTWTPKHMLRLWADYRLPGTWNRISIGAGVNSQSHTLSYDRQFDLPGFSIWSARAAYQINDDMSVAVNVNNLFDKTYYIPAYNSTAANNYYGDPRNVMFTVKYAPKF